MTSSRSLRTWSAPELCPSPRWSMVMRLLLVLVLTILSPLTHVDDSDAGDRSRRERNRDRRPDRSERDEPPRNRAMGVTRTHRVNKDGEYTHNRQDYKICDGCSAGKCKDAVKGNICPVNRREVHQCNRCLGQNCPLDCSKPSRGSSSQYWQWRPRWRRTRGPWRPGPQLQTLNGQYQGQSQAYLGCKAAGFIRWWMRVRVRRRSCPWVRG